MAALEVHLFGGIRLRLHGREITKFRSQKVASLLTHLLAKPERLHSRVELATLLFPDQDEPRARANLRTTLYHLNHLLHPKRSQKQPYLLITPQTIGFNVNSDYRLDVKAFEELLECASGQPAAQGYEIRLKALELYQGEYLAGFYEDWNLREQERLRLLYQETLSVVAQYEEENELLTQAVAHVREQLALSPLKEEAHRRLIRLLLKQGNPGAAWTQYRLCERLLALELAVAPEPETQLLRAKLEAHHPRSHDLRDTARRELERGRQALARGERESAERLLQSSRRRLLELQDPAEAEALFQLGRLALHQTHNLDLAQRYFTRVQALTSRNQDTALQALAINALGAVETARSQLDRAREYYQNALRLAEHGHHIEIHWRVLNNLGRNHWLQGRYDEALRCYVNVQLLCEQLNEKRGILIVLQNLGTLYSHLGLFSESQRCYQEAHALAESSEDPSWFKTVWHNWGDVYERQGEVEKAKHC